MALVVCSFNEKVNELLCENLGLSLLLYVPFEREFRVILLLEPAVLSMELKEDVGLLSIMLGFVIVIVGLG